MRRFSLPIALVSLGMAACGGGGGSSSAAPQSKEVATGDTLTDFQRRRLLGHYSTEDGASGFILDRTVTPPRAKLDGTDKVCPLEESNGPYHTKEYRCADHSIWLRISEDGDVQLFQGPKQHEGVRIVRDAEANQLK